jgi:hypothetical protein
VFFLFLVGSRGCGRNSVALHQKKKSTLRVCLSVVHFWRVACIKDTKKAQTAKTEKTKRENKKKTDELIGEKERKELGPPNIYFVIPNKKWF